MKKIEEEFEKLAANLAITEDIEKDCRDSVKYLYEDHLNYGFGYNFKKYRLGGSFDRHTLIAGNFDVDCFFVFNDWAQSWGSGQLTSLQSLNLSGNQLAMLPETFGQLTSLQSLDLRNNPLDSRADKILKKLRGKGVKKLYAY